MNERKVYLGKFNNSKKEELIEKSLKHLKDNRGDEFFYVLPNGELLKKYRRYFIENINSAFDINLLTFDDIVERFAGNLDYIDNAMKNLIIKNVLQELNSKKELDYFKAHIDMDGFVSSCNYIIGEIKRSLIQPEEYLDRCPRESLYLEIGYIYREYENTLTNLNLIDREGKYFLGIEKLKEKKGHLKNLKFIIIDEFYDFRPIEIALLKELSKEDLNIYINFPFDTGNRSHILENTLEILKELGFHIESVEKASFNYFEELGDNLFKDIESKFKKKDELKIIEGQSKYLEVKKIFQYIKRYYLEGEKLENMAIVLSHPDYIDTIHKVSGEDSVPISIPEKLQLNSLPIINEILNILSLNLGTNLRKHIINRVKSIYFPILNMSFNEKYEYILKKEKFENLQDLKALVYKDTHLNIEEKYLQDLNKIIDSLDTEIDSIKKRGTIEYYNNKITDILKEYEIDKKLLERYKTTQDYKLFERDMNTIKKLREILEKMKYLSIYVDEISLDDYYDYFLDYMKEEYIIIKHGDIKGVQVFNPVNMRGSQRERVFIVGLNGNYPIIEEENYYLNQYNYEKLNSIGIDIKTYMEKLSNEEIKFTSMISSSKKSLCLSYNGEESSNMISSFLEELLSLVDLNEKRNSNIEYIDLESFLNQKIDEITNNRELIRYLILNKIDLENGDVNLIDIVDFKSSLNIIYEGINIEKMRKEDEFNLYSGFIQDKEIIQDLENKKPEKFSVSYLESYGRCPYAFMLNNIFNIDEIDKALEDKKPMDIGNIYHQVLREFYLKYSKDIKDYLFKDRELDIDYREVLKELIIKNGESLDWDFLIEENKILLANTVESLNNFIEEDLKRMKRYEIFPYGFEVDFGIEETINIEYKGHKIPIRGRIDRIDKMRNKEKYMVMDYKSSSYGVRNIDDMLQGLSFQLPIYIMSQKKKEAVAGIYGIIREGKFSVRLGILGENSMVNKRLKGGLEREEWNALLDTVKNNTINTIENIQLGNFSVNPLECSSYCIYKDICRYEEVLEVENGDQ